ncbi:importin-9 [Marchantia polymorpha subsp. ruderalis]|uniref:Importin N-terminal domain-containing protein n=1 Tax=Marchantia polymorpha TaxID=3197 RepID=A0A2R6W2F2_MARPO|nr:hypothetical protein MARPO_0176s0015 [Marchantia polymorpha]BBN19279.1 hypothetical protein Mp_8g09320 [Marchantia polymorpha subsp. ruderalis]|eukprot:PTQ28032.1 hypothetical protein MARPO_0176s0015 [Marchantia polymorpha]
MENTGIAEAGQLVWLTNVLKATLDTNPGIRVAAEDALKNASIHPGYGVALAKVTVSKEVPIGLRQLAAVLLKQYVKHHWQAGEKDFLPPEASAQDKALIRGLLPQALEDPHGKIRTAVGMAIATIANSDWPEEWPDLMNYLLGFISDRSDINRVHGALRCLALFAGDLDDTLLPPLVPVLFPALHQIVAQPTMYDASLRRRALIVLHSCISTLGVMSGAYKTETRALMAPMLKSWLQQFALILSPPVPSEDPDDWSLRTEVLKSLQQIVTNFANIATTEFPVVLGPLWQTFVSGYKVYDSACINADEESFGGLADSDGSDQSLEAFTIQLFEFLLTAVGSPRFRKIVQNMEDLVYYTIGYMQMTEEQEQTWSADPNQYVADEDDVTFSCRLSGILLLEELVETFEDKALQAIVDAVQKRIVEAAQAKAAGRKNWWKLREAAILAVGTVAGSLFEAQSGGKMSFRLEPFLDSIRNEDLGQGIDQCSFLRGRALWAAAKFAPAMNKARSEQFFYAAVMGLASDVPPPIKIGACRALAELFPNVDPSVLQPHLSLVFASLGALLQEASDETLHLVLETLQAAVRANGQASAAAESTISPLVLNVWAKHVSDPFISIDALEILEAIKEVPGCLEPLAALVLPVLATIFANTSQQPVGMIAGALDLLTMLLKKAPKELVRRAHDVTFIPVLNIVLRSDDNSELQNATESLSAFVREGGEDLLSWGGDANRSLHMLLDAAGRLLNPELESSSALFVGGFVTALILNMSSNMAPHFSQLITALLARMRGSEMIALKTSILLVIARLVHMSAPNVGQFVDVVANLPVDYDALEYLMSEWTKLQGDIPGSYQMKVSTTAIALLLDCCHPQLARIRVQGHLLTNSSGVVTRSRSKVAPIQYSTMLLPAKLLSLLADALLEIQEQQTATARDEDDDWDEIDEDEDEPKATRSLPVPGSEQSVFKALDDMQHLLHDDIEDGDYQEDPVAATDPLNQINLSTHLRNFMKQFLAKDPVTSERLFQELNPRQKSAVQAAIA